ncbi:MAG: type II toxin-antitoxin system RelE/ParE family toxin [Luteolibacter sp.]
MKLLLTEAALADLKAIRDYTLENWGADQEERYLDSLWAKFEIILADLGRYRIRQDLFPDCRITVEGSHVILFRAGEKNLEIVRILHRAMDFKRHLPPSEFL